VETRSLKFVAEACAAEIRRGTGGTPVAGVCTDSRQAKPGDLFFAIQGERFDGHDFLNEVAAKGVAAIVVERSKVQSPKSKASSGARTPALDIGRLTLDYPDCAVLVVNDTRAALGKFAAAYRREFDLPVIAVGGSNGKTTTKELIASALRPSLATLWSEASFNNDIGVPLTLLRLDKLHRAAVLEAGTNHPGELAPLVKMIQPKYGVLTNIGREHLEFFGDVLGVVQEEGWLAELLPADGKLFVNGDNEWTDQIVRRTRAAVVRVGLGEKNEWQAKGIRLDKNGATFRVEAPKAEFSGEYRINLLGRHQVTNALFALAVSEELGLGRPAVRDGLAECQPPKMRLQLWEAGGVRVLDDAYNANADSTLAALETLCNLPLQGRRVAVLGDMNELGAHSEAAHAEVGRRAAELGIGQMFAIGKMAAVTARAAREAGLNRVMEFADVEAAMTAVENFLKAGDVVLLKASRAARLERIAAALKSEKS
jgi:UDP-N-acetylmuramoyl-tripeptide--D-alanyl-D-alanine ligase